MYNRLWNQLYAYPYSAMKHGWRDRHAVTIIWMQTDASYTPFIDIASFIL